MVAGPSLKDFRIRALFLPLPMTLPSALPAAANPSNIQVFGTSAAARAEVLRRDPTLEHAIGQYRDEKSLHFYVTTGTAHSVSIVPGYNMYMHTHPGAKSYALPSFRDMCTFAGQAKDRLSYETMIYSTSSTHPGMSHLRWLGERRFHLIYADGARPSASPTAPQFFGPTREFDVTIEHDPVCNHHELVVTTRATATPLTYKFTEHDFMSSSFNEQWLWGCILAGHSPEEVSSSVRRSSVRRWPAISTATARPLRSIFSTPALISPSVTSYPGFDSSFIAAANNWLTSAMIAAGLPPPKPSP